MFHKKESETFDGKTSVPNAGSSSERDRYDHDGRITREEFEHLFVDAAKRNPSIVKSTPSPSKKKKERRESGTAALYVVFERGFENITSFSCFYHTQIAFIITRDCLLIPCHHHLKINTRMHLVVTKLKHQRSNTGTRNNFKDRHFLKRLMVFAKEAFENLDSDGSASLPMGMNFTILWDWLWEKFSCGRKTDLREKTSLCSKAFRTRLINRDGCISFFRVQRPFCQVRRTCCECTSSS